MHSVRFQYEAQQNTDIFKFKKLTILKGTV